nr:uncharacterized protein LOC109983449 [Labrus bergylta]
MDLGRETTPPPQTCIHRAGEINTLICPSVSLQYVFELLGLQTGCSFTLREGSSPGPGHHSFTCTAPCLNWEEIASTAQIIHRKSSKRSSSDEAVCSLLCRLVVSHSGSEWISSRSVHKYQNSFMPMFHEPLHLPINARLYRILIHQFFTHLASPSHQPSPPPVSALHIQTSMPPGTLAEGSDRWGDLDAKLQRGKINIWLSSRPEFTDQQLTVTAMFGSHSANNMND